MMLCLVIDISLCLKDGKMSFDEVFYILKDGGGTLLAGILNQKSQAGFPSIFDDVGFRRRCFGRNFVSPDGNKLNRF